MMKIVPTLNLFRPGEAEAITGLSTAMQRDYRRRGFLPKNEGHARFNVFELAEMFMLKQLSDRGFWPEFFAPVAHLAAKGVALQALKFADAYEGTLELIEGFCPVSQDPAGEVFRAYGIKPEYARYLVIWGHINPVGGVMGDHNFTDDLNAVFSEEFQGRGRAHLLQEGPSTVYNLEMTGLRFLRGQLEDKAFVRLSLSPQEDEG